MKAKSFEIRLSPEVLADMGAGDEDLRRAIGDQVKRCLDLEAEPEDKDGYEIDRTKTLMIHFAVGFTPGVDPVLDNGDSGNADGCHPGCARYR